MLLEKKAQKRNTFDHLLADSNVHTEKSQISNHQDIRLFTGPKVDTVTQVPVVVKGLFSGQDISVHVSQSLFSTAVTAQVIFGFGVTD